jgi:hypothetical protein
MKVLVEHGDRMKMSLLIECMYLMKHNYERKDMARMVYRVYQSLQTGYAYELDIYPVYREPVYQTWDGVP